MYGSPHYSTLYCSMAPYTTVQRSVVWLPTLQYSECSMAPYTAVQSSTLYCRGGCERVPYLHMQKVSIMTKFMCIYKGKPYLCWPQIWGRKQYQSWHTYFSCQKGLTWDIYSPYRPWGMLKVSPGLKLQSVCYSMFCPLGLNEWKQPLQRIKICSITLI